MADWSLYSSLGQRKYITADEGQRFLAAAMRGPMEQSALAALLACTGCRVSEALALTRFQLDVEQCQVVFRTLKGAPGRFRAVPVPAPLMLLLLNRAELSGNGRLFACCRQTVWRHVRAAMARAGIDGPQANPRGLRHGFGVACALERLDPRHTQQLLGHSKSETTAIYLQIYGEEVRRLIACIWPQEAVKRLIQGILPVDTLALPAEGLTACSLNHWL